MRKKKVVWIPMVTIVLVVILMVCGFTYLYFNGMSGVAQTSVPKEGQIKIACVGDSITYGHGVSNWPENNYPKLLQGMLGENYHVQSYGVSGRAVQDNSDQPYRALKHYSESIAYDADIIVFMMGTNDSKPENWFGEEAFKTAVLDLLDDYLTGDKQPQIYLCTPASAFFTEGFSGELTSHDIQPGKVDVIADIIREIAQENGYSIIDIHTLTKANPQWFEKDGVHPNNDGAAAIAHEVYNAFTK